MFQLSVIFLNSPSYLREVDDWLSHMAEVQCLYVVERFYGGKIALTRFIRLPGTQKPVEGEEGLVQFHWW